MLWERVVCILLFIRGKVENYLLWDNDMKLLNMKDVNNNNAEYENEWNS